jgi:transketolase
MVIIDRNRQCVLDFTEDCSPLDPLISRLEAFGWETREVNGHVFEELLEVLGYLSSRTSSKPLAVVANTIKGRGVSFMEGQIKWHHAVPAGEELVQARRELAP